MKTKLILFIFLLLGLFCSCNECKERKILEKVNAFLQEEKVDSAEYEIYKLTYSQLEGEDLKAYYGLLRTHLTYTNGDNISQNDKLINQSLLYYRDLNDDKNLAECYFYKGCCEYQRQDIKFGFKNMKSAEYFAFKTNDITLRHKVVEVLQVWNNNAGEYDMAIRYGKMNIDISDGNYNWLAYAYGLLAMSYQNIGSKVKSLYYMNKSFRCISEVPEKSQGQFYANMGMMFLQSKPDFAVDCFQKGLEYRNSMAYLGLGIYMYNKGMKEIADSMFVKALDVADTPQKHYLYYHIQRLSAENGNYEKAYNYMCDYVQLQKLITDERNESNAHFVQNQLAQSIKEFKLHKMICTILLLAVIIAATVLVILFWWRCQTVKAKKETSQNSMILGLYKNKLKEMESRSVGHQNKTDEEEIKRRIKKIEEQKTKMLSNGNVLYENIIEKGENIITWSKRDYENFLEYYKLKDFEYMLQLETDYVGLSPRYQLFLVLQHIGKSGEDIQEIMTISSGAVRTIRSRIISRKKP